MSKELLDLIKTNLQQEEGKEIKEEELTNYDEWIEAQASKLIINNLRSIEKREDKIAYLNKITNNTFQIENKRIMEKGNLLNTDFDELTTTTLHNREIYKKIRIELENCEEAIIVSPFISIDLTLFKMAFQRNERITKLTIITTTMNKEKPNINLELLKKIKALNPNKIDIIIENVQENTKRLHAKIYYFKRPNNLSSLYVGSANLSHTGTVNGNEFSVKLSEFEHKYQFDGFKMFIDNLISSDNMINISNQEEIGKLEAYLNAINAKTQQEEKLIAEYNSNSLDEERTDAGLKRLETFFPGEFKLFDYQTKAINNLEKRYRNGHRKHLVVMATGTGKTIVALSYVNAIAARMMKDKIKVLFIAHREEILSQTALKFISQCNYEESDIARFYSGIKNDDDLNNKSLYIGSVQTLINRFELLKQHKFDLIIFDEVHHVDEDAKTFFKLFNLASEIGNEVLGLTATPVRTNGVNVQNYFDGDVAFNLPLFQALQNDSLAPYDYFLMYSDDLIDFDIENDEEALTRFMSQEKKIDLIMKIVNENIGFSNIDTSCLIFCPTILSAIYIKDELRKRNIKVSALVSGDFQNEDRSEIIQKFKDKKINYLCVVNIFNEGVDIPQINNIIFMRPTTSQLVFVQQLGRGLRRFGDKRLKVFDVVNNIVVQKNKKYNPLHYLSSIARVEGNMDNIISSPKVIDQLIPDSCNFYINREDENNISKVLKDIFSNSLINIKEKLLDYRKDLSFDSYCRFMNNHILDPKALYNKNYTFLCERREWISFLLYSISIINIHDVLSEILKISEAKVKSKNQIVNKIFLKAYYNSSNMADISKSIDELWVEIFEDKNNDILREISYCCRFLIENKFLIEKNIDDSLESFEGIKVTQQLAFTIVYDDILRSLSMTAPVKSCSWANEEKTKMVITTTLNKLDNSFLKYDYENFIDSSGSFIHWAAPGDWRVDDNQKLRNYGVENYAVSKYVFFSEREFSEEIKNNKKNNIFKLMPTVYNSKVITNEFDSPKLSYKLFFELK